MEWSRAGEAGCECEAGDGDRGAGFGGQADQLLREPRRGVACNLLGGELLQLGDRPEPLGQKSLARRTREVLLQADFDVVVDVGDDRAEFLFKGYGRDFRILHVDGHERSPR